MSDFSMDNQQAPPFTLEYIQHLISTRVQQETSAVHNELATMHQHNQQLQAQLAAVQHGQPTVQQHNNGIGNGARPSKPTRYDGAMGTDPTVWLFQFKQYADITQVPLAHQPKLAATYLDDKAATWWMHLVSQQPHNSADGITWPMFSDGLLTAFKPVNSKKIARNKLAVLKQTHSVQKYNDDFRALCRDIDDMNDAEQLDRYMRGLKAHICERVELSQPTTLHEAMSRAHTIDSISYYSRMSQNNNSTYQNYTPASHNNDAMVLGAVSDTPDSTTDDTLNAVAGRYNNQRRGGYGTINSQSSSRTFTPLQRLSQEDFAYCQRNRLCLKCKEAGHIARNCSRPVKPLNLRAR
jgi:hypothetical protein